MRLLKHLAVCIPLTLCVLGIQGTACGQDDQAIEELKTRVDGFFTNLANEEQKPKQVFQDILADGPLASRNEAIDRLVTSFEEIKEGSGMYSESESVSEKRVGTDLILLKFVYKAENYPVIWYFTFYRRPSDKMKWILISLRFNTRLDQLER